jgi:hypothetical protein
MMREFRDLLFQSRDVIRGEGIGAIAEAHSQLIRDI